MLLRALVAFVLASLTACNGGERSTAPPAEQETDGPRRGGGSGRTDSGSLDDDAPSADDDASVEDDDAPNGDDDSDTDASAGGVGGEGPSPVLDGGAFLTDGAVSSCGDGVTDDEREECDPSAEPRLSCQELGFASGEIACSSECLLDTTSCIGSELCSDGRDNDGDTVIDCDDEDCAEDCADSCLGAVDIATLAAGETVRIEGTTLGHAQRLEPSCGAEGGASEIVYRYLPSGDGLLEVGLESGALLLASARTSCEDDLSELACGLIGVTLDVPIVRDEPVFIVVDGREAADEGNYSLFLNERVVACGNGLREGTESCDDGNANDADGCNASCELNRKETEPNDDAASANEFSNPHYAEIAPSSDVDLVVFEVNEASNVRLRIIDLGDSACADNSMDPLLRLLDEALEPLAEDDDSGEGFCAELDLAVDAGTYYVEVSRASAGAETFPYRLVLNVAPAAP